MNHLRPENLSARGPDGLPGGLPDGLPEYRDVTTRILRDEERPYPSRDRSLPLVIEAKEATDLSFLRTFLSSHASEVLERVQQYGAVLLRGFAVRRPEDFESVTASIAQLSPINRYFMSEPGRKITPGTENVFNTNSIARTGGGFVFGAFHSENYHSPDVPTFVGFCALKDSWMGSETCLVNMSNVYDELPATLTSKLEASAYVSSIWALSAVAERYGVSCAVMERHCREAGLTVETCKGQQYIVLSKPSIYRHPRTDRLSLEANLFSMLKHFKSATLLHFSRHYSDWKWTLHRAVWRIGLDNLMFILGAMPRLATQPEEARKLLNVLRPRDEEGNRPGILESIAAFLKYDSFAGVLEALRKQRLGDIVSREETDLLAKLIERHSSVFGWRSGDILLLDNQQLLHAGMPGFGPRELLAMFFNPIPFRYPATSGIGELLEHAGDYASILDRLDGPTAGKESP